jgi:hypothetical protein
MHKGYVKRDGEIEKIVEDGWYVPKTSWLLTAMDLETFVVLAIANKHIIQSNP